ncbi:beta-glucosidase 12-like isoform X1 [Cucurbita moschata]|uniref:Beta-glucosidase 12-like isoform X1 n=2 Tax=Cucurbita moschata TaxID=3662 RepID=A0A6J1HBR5_CUCMO|nr:beta-glucosidase 12-like isoform X1 [Cucurbita moschata]
MAIRNDYVILFFLNFVCLLLVEAQDGVEFQTIKRSNFPNEFDFGASSSAYQYEGGVSSKGKSIWDTFTHKYPDKIADGSNGDVALDAYHRYKEDLSLMKDTGFNAYRFSIAWSRILPDGTVKGGVNQEGINYYNNLIDEALKKGLKPYATLFHWDVPQALEDKYGGFLDRQILNDFEDYVDVCFNQFGDRVKHWITLNEPNMFAINGYAQGTFAPGRCSRWILNNCYDGDSSKEPYIVGHNQILAHARAVKVYRTKYQRTQKGVIGITVIGNWYEPYSNTFADEEAAKRAIEFFSGWFFNPIVHGDYPQSMRLRVKDRLPTFTQDEATLIKCSYDFLGLNYYTAAYAIDDSSAHVLYPSWRTDSGVNTSISLGPKVNASSWLSVYPKGLQKLLITMKNDYDNPSIYITENGFFDYDDPSARKLLCDRKRIFYHMGHLYFLRQAMRDGVRVNGYFAWSFLDNFEWSDGYTKRFGLVYIDRNNNLTRTPKDSLKWFSLFLKG